MNFVNLKRRDALFGRVVAILLTSTSTSEQILGSSEAGVVLPHRRQCSGHRRVYVPGLPSSCASIHGHCWVICIPSSASTCTDFRWTIYPDEVAKMKAGGKGDIPMVRSNGLPFIYGQPGFLTLRFGSTHLFSFLEGVLGRTGPPNDGRAIQ